MANQSFSASVSSSAVVILAVTGSAIASFGGSALSAVQARVNVIDALPSSGVTFSGRASSSMKVTVRLSSSDGQQGMTVADIVKESLTLWGFLCADNAPRYALDRAITDLNTALQSVWNNADGHDFWSNETLTITIQPGGDFIDLSDTVQNVVGPCRRADNRRPLTPLSTIGELESFTQLYLDGDDASEPLAYYVDRSRQHEDDPSRCVFRVAPAVADDPMDFLLEVVKEAPRYSADDMLAPPLVPIPHRYTESLLIPIVRYHASSYFLFASADPTQKQTIDQEYLQARVALGLADPSPTSEGGDK